MQLSMTIYDILDVAHYLLGVDYHLFDFDLRHVFETGLWTVDTFLCSIISVAWLFPGDTCTYPAWFVFPLLTGSLHY